METKTKYVLTYRQSHVEFATKQAMLDYLEDFTKLFDDFDMSLVKMFKLDITEIVESKN